MSRAARFIETVSGERFYPFDPHPEDVRLADVAGGLAHTCRFGGHVEEFYSVAEHSLLVARELEDEAPRVRLHGLLHDAGEAYLGDVPRPVKAAFPDLQAVEADVRAAVWAGLDVSEPTDEEWSAVMAADDRLLAYEARELLADGSWVEETVDLGYELGGQDPGEVRESFAARVETLVTQVE